MKKEFLSVLGLSLLVLFSCKKEEDPGSDTNTNDPGTTPVSLSIESSPSAKAEDDQKSSGVYKGTFVGSSGFYKLTLQSDDISGILILNGTGYQLSTSDVSSSDLGNAISNAVFKDNSGTVNLTFSVDADGQNPIVSLNISGHTNIQTIVAKETSTNHVKVYGGPLYYSYGDSVNAYQCVFNTNVLIAGMSGTTSIVYKYDHSNVFQGTANCDVNDYGRIDGYEYTIASGNINMFTYVSECDTCPQMKESFLGVSENGTVSDNDLFFAGGSWIESGHTLQDSLHFYRKL
ncbi:MAG: hypothetical protein EP338_11245 [Bacteroidetes bacterium]|nr:MAG: hypothetical protein EP338_11245 [Bacteroidota bacterium]